MAGYSAKCVEHLINAPPIADLGSLVTNY